MPTSNIPSGMPTAGMPTAGMPTAGMPIAKKPGERSAKLRHRKHKSPPREALLGKESLKEAEHGH